MDDLDPAAADTLDDLAACLRRLHLGADRPTYRSLEQQTIHANSFLPGTRLKRVRLSRNTLSDVLLGRKYPSKAFLLTFVDACGIDIENDPRWEEAWDRLAVQYLYQGAELGVEQLRRQLAEAEARADQAVRDANELRKQLAFPGERKVPSRDAISFWDALNPVEREALRSVASWRTFPAGVRLMEEGERADHAIVILGGRAEIRVNDNGTERVIAVRGLGQILGERSTLKVSVRSATVVALDMIWALVVQTRDFAAFVSAHPRVLGIMENIAAQRRTEGPVGYARDSLPLINPSCTVFLTDVVGFGGHARTDIDRSLIREALFKMTETVVDGMPNARIEDRGDGFLTVVPPGVSAARVIAALLNQLPAALDRHNSTHSETARFQLRLAVNIGPVATDIAGVSGEAIIVAARLVEAPHFKEALAKSSASLGVVASPFAYEAVIKRDMGLYEEESYDQVLVEVKEFITTAWMKLINYK